MLIYKSTKSSGQLSVIHRPNEAQIYCRFMAPKTEPSSVSQKVHH